MRINFERYKIKFISFVCLLLIGALNPSFSIVPVKYLSEKMLEDYQFNNYSVIGINYCYYSSDFMQNITAEKQQIIMNMKEMSTETDTSQNKNIKTLLYNEITFTAPNLLPKPYHVLATKGGKVMWQINTETASSLTAQQKADLKDGGIEKMEIQNVKDSDLDSSADNYFQLKKYIGKPALYIYYSKKTVINRMSSWLIVDIYTGETIGFIVFN